MNDRPGSPTPTAPTGGGRTHPGPAAARAVHVFKRYGSTVALHDAAITVHTGQTHALVGRNGAGKSTMVSILTGLQAPDSGEVTFGGAPAPRLTDRDAWRRQVACVYQRSTIIPELTVAENLFLNRQPRRGRLVRWSTLYAEAERVLRTWGVDVDPRQAAADLDIERRQFVEIARALSFGARFIILDEPTAQLDGAAIERLFGRIRDLQAQGVTFLFISHHLQEVYEICDTVTVFRDARHVLTAPVADLTRTDLVEAMTGDAAAQRLARDRPKAAAGTDLALDLRELNLPGAYENVTAQVRRGEIVGLAGAAASGKSELAETVAGLRRATGGSVAVCGVTTRPGDVGAALAAGVGFVPQDRHHEGLVGDMSIADNATLTIPRRLGPAGFINPSRRTAIARRLIDNLAIKSSGPEQPVSDLSGGNQQKVVMARALANDPGLMVLITPTAGVDVRSKEFLLDKVEEVAAAGAGVVIASDELDDLRICDRVVVMFQGRVVAEMPSGWQDRDLVAAMEGLAPDA
ncbi:sugar ABC transporter ATP-binding protein [Asanoa siamensis]|uniref:Multidrug ABC transporter ATP-binding protein n=1 Tax=Asanoa siamensis TaxID=926357 RepID=A0ABQ4D2B4_9ACTN|nr:sugar ABC transporter ATP-binding protein [Asanoa siamensis]GIF77682.1 multidrug ABC transporter ATP-binding protein [Asanoa siamensis]